MRVLLTLLLALGAFQSYAQGYAAVGFSVARFNLEGLNNVIQDYNEARPWLDKQSQEFGNLSGLSLQFGAVEGVWLDWTANFRRQKRTSYGIEPNKGKMTRDLKVRNVNTALTVGGAFPTGDAALAIGLRGELSTFRMMSRVYGENETKGIYAGVGSNNFLVGIGPTFKLFAGEEGMFIVSVYYAHTLPKLNWADLGNNLNPTTTSTNKERYDTKNHAFGFTIAIGRFVD